MAFGFVVLQEEKEARIMMKRSFSKLSLGCFWVFFSSLASCPGLLLIKPVVERHVPFFDYGSVCTDFPRFLN